MIYTKFLHKQNRKEERRRRKRRRQTNINERNMSLPSSNIIRLLIEGIGIKAMHSCHMMLTVVATHSLTVSLDHIFTS